MEDIPVMDETMAREIKELYQNRHSPAQIALEYGLVGNDYYGILLLSEAATFIHEDYHEWDYVG